MNPETLHKINQLKDDLDSIPPVSHLEFQAKKCEYFAEIMLLMNKYYKKEIILNDSQIDEMRNIHLKKMDLETSLRAALFTAPLSNETINDLSELGISPLSKHIDLIISHHEKLGDGVIRTICKIENIEVVRIVQLIYGKIVGGKPCWRVRENLVNSEVCDFLEHLFLAKAENSLIPFA